MTSIADVRERQRAVLDRARPVDRRARPDRWSAADFVSTTRTQMLSSFWGCEVPGSGAYDELLTGAVVAASQLGWSTGSACEALTRGWRAVDAGDDEVRKAALADAVFDALETGRPGNAGSFGSPPRFAPPAPLELNIGDLEQRMLASWQAKIAGGAFGTALEGCRGQAIEAVYGPVRAYVSAPSTLNDDVVYELVALDVIAAHGMKATTADYAQQWLARIPFGWSAEWVTLDNLQRGSIPSNAAVLRNPMTSWIGAQMRGMVFGQLTPGHPENAAALARIEASVSHRGDGVEGGAFAAILSSLAFARDDAQLLVAEALTVLPASSYRSSLELCAAWCAASASFDDVWPLIEARFVDHNWVHAIPNAAAVVCALWFGGGDVTESFALLARAGLDVDCNAGLVGTVLGAMHGHVPSEWTDPLNDRIDTYLLDLPSVSISELAERTLRIVHSLDER